MLHPSSPSCVSPLEGMMHCPEGTDFMQGVASLHSEAAGARKEALELIDRAQALMRWAERCDEVRRNSVNERALTESRINFLTEHLSEDCQSRIPSMSQSAVIPLRQMQQRYPSLSHSMMSTVGGGYPACREEPVEKIVKTFSVTNKNGRTRTLRVLEIFRSPRAVVVPDFLSDSEVLKMRRALADRGWWRSNGFQTVRMAGKELASFRKWSIRFMSVLGLKRDRVPRAWIAYQFTQNIKNFRLEFCSGDEHHAILMLEANRDSVMNGGSESGDEILYRPHNSPTYQDLGFYLNLANGYLLSISAFPSDLCYDVAATIGQTLIHIRL